MSDLGEPAVYRPGVRCVVCLRCRTRVGIESMGSSFRVHYNIGQWHRSAGCCLHLGGPMSCCHFGKLWGVIGDMRVPH